MPLIRVTAQKETFDEETKNKFMSEITDAVLVAEGAELNDPAAEAVAWAYYNEQDSKNLFIAKKNIKEPPIIIRVTTPKGGFNREAREGLAANVNEIVNDFIGPYEGRLNHWLLMDDIGEDGWASNGIVLSIGQIFDVMNIKK